MTDTDSLAKVVAELRGIHDHYSSAIIARWADRIERLDAEMRTTCNGFRDDYLRVYREYHELRARLSACEKGFEARYNEDGTLDEIVGTGTVHLEQMSDSHWWIGFGDGPLLHVNLSAKGKIKAIVDDERAAQSSAKGVDVA